ncbi:MAG: caspase family protein [Saprospiraceae bacterium]
MPNKEDISIDLPPQWAGSHPNGKTYLLFIAIDRYTNGVTPLSNAVRDAEAVAQCLLDHYELDEKHCKMLINEEATNETITQAFDEYLALLTDQDNLLFYFSGHGFYHNPTKKGYWLTAEAKSGQRHTFFSNDEVISFVHHLKARHVFGIVDSCFSAALFADRKADPTVSRRYNIPSRWLLTAGRLEPVSDGSLGDHSPFAKALLTQLTYQEKPHLWVSELCFNVLEGVTDNTEQQLPRGQPLQNAGNQGGEFVLLRKGQAIPLTGPILSDTSVKDPIKKENREEIEKIPTRPIDLKDKTLAEIKDTLEELVPEEEWQLIFDLLKAFLGRGRKRNTLLQLMARYNSIKKEDTLNTQSPEQIRISYNRIRHDFLTFINDLNERDRQ